MRVLFVGAHPDDIELGAGGTLIKHIKRGDEIMYVCMSRGEKGGDPKEREMELLEVLNHLKIKNYRLFDFPDTLFNTKLNEMKDLLESIIKEFKPDRIYTHSLNDSHQDHKTLAEAVKIAGRYIPQILSFWSPLLYNNFSPNYFIDISDVFQEKLNLLEKYKSQKDKDFLKREIIIAINRYFGFMNKVEYAEGFEIIKYRELNL
jgi:LmbE family N-acetylglucosaminyl deacetylase